MKVINEEKCNTTIRDILFWTGFDFSEDKLTEKQDLIYPVERKKEKNTDMFDSEGIKEIIHT